MRKKTLRTKVMCALLSLVFLASLFNVELPVEAKAGTATIPVTIGGKTYQITPGQNVTVNTPGGSTTYNVRFVDGKPVALDMTQHTSLIFGDGAGATNSGTSTGATTSKPTTGTNGASTSGNVGTGNSSSASQSTGATNSGNAAQSSSSASQSSTPSASTSSNNSGNMTWNEFQKANAGKGMSSSEMSQAWKDYKAGNTGSTSSSAAQSGSSSSSSAAQTSGSNTGSSSPAPQASVAEGAATTNSGSAQGTSVSSEAASQGNSNWNPAKHPRDPQTGKFISHEEAIARGLMDPADANINTNGSSSQTAQSGEATQSQQTTGGSSSEAAQASTEGAQSGSTNGGESGTAAQVAQTSGEASQASGGKTKTTIGDKFKAGYTKGKELTNAGVQNVKDSLKSGFSAKNILVTAGITVGVDLATQIMRGENPSLKSALKTVCCAEFVGGVTGSVLGAATGSFFVPFLSCIPVVGGALSALAPTFGSVVGSSVGAYLAGDLKNGRFSIKEAFKRIDWVGVTGQTIGSTVGAALGSCLGPVGTVLGGMAGGYLGNWAAHKIAGLFGKGEANLPTIAMPTGENGGGSVTTAGTITIGGDDVTGVVIADPVNPQREDNDKGSFNIRTVDTGDIDAKITAAYEEYTKYYEEYSNLIQAGKQAEAIEVAQKMNQAKAKYDSLRYQD